MNGKIYYWDSCIFLAWLKNEARPNGQMAGVCVVAEEFERGECIIMTSTLTRTEILSEKTGEEAVKKYQAFRKRKQFQEVQPTPPVMDLAGEIRNYYVKQKAIDKLPTLATPDSIHLASAIIYEATAFHTFDEKNDKKRRALIPLNGNVAGYPLRICFPSASQMHLNYEPIEAPEKDDED